MDWSIALFPLVNLGTYWLKHKRLPKLPPATLPFVNLGLAIGVEYATQALTTAVGGAPIPPLADIAQGGLQMALPAFVAHNVAKNLPGAK